jgi:hypothetical protein
MLRLLAMTVLAVAALGLRPADAHVGTADPVVFEAPVAATAPVPLVGAQAPVANDSTDLPSAIAAMAVVAAIVLVRWRSRRLAAAVLVLLISTFGIETATHSVHHALSDHPVACAAASIAAHSDGTAVVAVTLDEPIHRIGVTPDPSAPSRPSDRSLAPPNTRAPPAARV